MHSRAHLLNLGDKPCFVRVPAFQQRLAQLEQYRLEEVVHVRRTGTILRAGDPFDPAPDLLQRRQRIRSCDTRTGSASPHAAAARAPWTRRATQALQTIESNRAQKMQRREAAEQKWKPDENGADGRTGDLSQRDSTKRVRHVRVLVVALLIKMLKLLTNPGKSSSLMVAIACGGKQRLQAHAAKCEATFRQESGALSRGQPHVRQGNRKETAVLSDSTLCQGRDNWRSQGNRRQRALPKCAEFSQVSAVCPRPKSSKGLANEHPEIMLVVVVGRPCTGKTAIVKALEAFLIEQGKTVTVVNEEALHIVDGYASAWAVAGTLLHARLRAVCACSTESRGTNAFCTEECS